LIITGGSLFSGIGGFDLAASAAGIDIRFQVEIDKYCRKVLKKHARKYWQNAVQFGDIRNVTVRDCGYVDVLFGGFPCQDISTLNQKGLGIHGERSGLWREFARLIAEIRPKAVLLENVVAIRRRGLDVVLSDLAALGYDARWGIIPAAVAGAPHRRRRWWLVGYPSGVEFKKLDKPEFFNDQAGQSADQFEKLDECLFFSTNNVDRVEAVRFGNEQIKKFPNQSRICRDADGLSARLDRHLWPSRPFHTPRRWESARIVEEKVPFQSKRVQTLGNAIVPQVCYPLFVEIVKQLKQGQIT
jgi:DNA (cytosine-5)-methyltransferase 1